MSWEVVKFSDLFSEGQRNGLTKPRSVRGTGIKFINMGELFEYDRIDGSVETDRVPVSQSEMESSLLQTNDLLFARQSLVREGAGKCSIVLNLSEPTTYDSHLIRVRLDQKKASSQFYQYYFASPLSPIPGIVSQCAQAGVKGSDLANLGVVCPPIDIQRRISDVLSAYDDLIDNCRRQIKLLEEAAQRLYREWFVDMRFPGHEDVDFVDGLPEGWAKCRLSDFAEFRRGKVITAKQTKPGTVPVVAGGLTPAYYHDASNTVAPVITVSGSGANAGYTALYGREIWASDCSFLDSEKTDYIYFVFLTVKVLGRGFKHLQRGSAQPHVYPSHINELEFIRPSCGVLKEFEMLVESMFKKVRVLETMIEQLQEARDRLLPKLMSGEIEV